MKILVTGASGFIGQNLVGQLLKDGHSVRAIYRRKKLPEFLQSCQQRYQHQLELIRADLNFKSSMPNFSDPLCAAWLKSSRIRIPMPAYGWPIDPDDLHMAGTLFDGMDACVHIAAMVGDWGTKHDFFAANVNPTRIIIEAAMQHKLSRFIYCSSISVHGFGHRGSTEAGPYFPVGNWYPRSKRLAESIVLDAMNRGLDGVVIRPGNVYGPGDTTTFYPFFEAMEKGVGGTLGRGQSLTCPIYIDDLVKGMAQAIAVKKPKLRCFNLCSGEHITWRELTDLSSDALGLQRTWINLPSSLAYIFALLGEVSFRIIRSRVRPPFTWYMVSQVLRDYHFSTEAARAVLDYHPKTLAPEGIKLTAAAYLREKAQRAIATTD